MGNEREELLSYLKQTRSNLVDLAQSLTPADLAKPTENEGWSVKDTLSHAVASEAGLTAMAIRLSRGEEMPRPSGPPVDLNTRNQQAVEVRRDRPISELLAELLASRQTLVETLAGMTDEQLATPAPFPPGRANTVSGILRMIGQHEESHGGEIRKALGR